MVGIVHVRLVLPLPRLLLLQLLGLELLNLLLERVILRKQCTVSLIAFRHLLLVDEQLRDDLIHRLIVRANLRSLILLNYLPPVHIFKLVAHVALPDDRLENLDAVTQLAIFSR